jgi:muramoyltetrapeptide carboxypeptidase
LAGDDETKLETLHAFFRNPEIDCILCSRGGYGGIRHVDKIDYSIICENPKAFCGYPDVTALSAMILKHAGLVTYSSPMVVGDFGVENPSNFTIENFVKAKQKPLEGYMLIIESGCDTCTGGEYPADEDVTLPPFHPNCNCTFYYELTDNKDDINDLELDVE